MPHAGRRTVPQTWLRQRHVLSVEQQIFGYSALRRLRGLEGENARLKRMLADLELQNAFIKGIPSRKS